MWSAMARDSSVSEIGLLTLPCCDVLARVARAACGGQLLAHGPTVGLPQNKALAERHRLKSLVMEAMVPDANKPEWGECLGIECRSQLQHMGKTSRTPHRMSAQGESAILMTALGCCSFPCLAKIRAFCSSSNGNTLMPTFNLS